MDGEAVPKITIGLDVGDRSVHLHAVDQEGETLETARLATTQAALRMRFEGMAPARVVLEVGPHSPWMSRLLDELGHEVIVANPRKLAFIYRSDSKGDSPDAEALARVGRMDVRLLRPVEHRSAAAQADLAVVRARYALVRSRTRLVNHIRGAAKAQGLRLPRCSTASFARKASESLPDPLRTVLTPTFAMIAELTTQIRIYDREIERLCAESHPDTAVLRQVPGVGPLTALAFVLTLEDPGRFKKSRAVGAFLGLRPRRAQSGGRDPELRITKAGDELLRTLLVQAAHYVLGPFGPDTDLRRFGLALAARGGKNAKKRAIVATARKLAVLLHRLWTTGEVYEPLRNTRLDHAA